MVQSADAFEQLAAVGLLGNVWPPERVMVGLAVCRSLREHLPAGAACCVVVVCRNRGMPAAISEMKCPLFVSACAVHPGAARCSSTATWLETLQGARIETLGLARCALGADKCAALASLLQTRPRTCPGALAPALTLRELDLSHNAIDAEHVALFRALGGLANLRVLSLAGNTLQARGCGMLAAAVAGLDFEDGRDDQLSAVRRPSPCAGLRQLSTLHIGSNDLGDEALPCLRDVIPQLTSLSLSENKIGDEGVACLAPALATCTALQFLDLSRNLVTDEGERALSRVLRRRMQVALS